MKAAVLNKYFIGTCAGDNHSGQVKPGNVAFERLRIALRATVLASLATVATGVALTPLMAAPWQLVLLWGVVVGAAVGGYFYWKYSQDKIACEALLKDVYASPPDVVMRRLERSYFSTSLP